MNPVDVRSRACEATQTNNLSEHQATAGRREAYQSNPIFQPQTAYQPSATYQSHLSCTNRRTRAHPGTSAFPTSRCRTPFPWLIISIKALNLHSTTPKQRRKERLVSFMSVSLVSRITRLISYRVTASTRAVEAVGLWFSDSVQEVFLVLVGLGIFVISGKHFARPWPGHTLSSQYLVVLWQSCASNLLKRLSYVYTDTASVGISGMLASSHDDLIHSHPHSFPGICRRSGSVPISEANSSTVPFSNVVDHPYSFRSLGLTVSILSLIANAMMVGAILCKRRKLPNCSELFVIFHLIFVVALFCVQLVNTCLLIPYAEKIRLTELRISHEDVSLGILMLFLEVFLVCLIFIWLVIFTIAMQWLFPPVQLERRGMLSCKTCSDLRRVSMNLCALVLCTIFGRWSTD